MGRIGRIADVVRNGSHYECTVNTGDNSVITAELFLPAGEDTVPLNGDVVALLETPRLGSAVIVGIIDQNLDAVSDSGDKRMFSRDSSGSMVGEIWIKSDGTLKLSNGSGGIELKADGTVIINGVNISPSGEITSNALIQGAVVKANPAPGITYNLATHGHTAFNVPPTPEV